MKLSSVLRIVLLIIGFIITVIFLGYIIYSVFFRGEAKPGQQLVNVNGVLINASELPLANENVNRPIANVNEEITALPISRVARGGDTLVNDIVDISVDGVTVAGSNLRYYDKTTGQFYQISPDGKIKSLLSDEIFPEVDTIAWAPDASQVILTFPDETNILYDFNSKKQATLPKEMKEIEVSPTGSEIGFEYVTDNPDNNFLGVSKPNGSEIKAVEALGDQSANVAVNWSPSNQVLATFRKGSSGENQEIFFVGLQGENFKSLEVEGRGFEANWNQSGDKLLYSTYDSATNYNPELKFVDYGGDNTGRNVVNTGLNTWPSKCAIGTSSAYCGVPSYLEKGSGIYPEIANNIPDVFYRIDLRTGTKTKLANPVNQDGTGIYNASQVYLSPDESILYFTDTNTGKLQSVKLK